VIANDRHSTILLPPNAKRSIIDLVFISSTLVPLCTSFTESDPADSDDFPIHTFISGSFSKKNIFMYKLKICKKDINLLYHNLCESFTQLETLILENSVTTTLNTSQHIKQHAHSLFPPGARFPRSEILRKFLLSPFWWNDECGTTCNQESTLLIFSVIFLVLINDYLNNQ